MTPRCPNVNAGHIGESEVTLWDGAGERQLFAKTKEIAFLYTYK